jgi:general L-amino acid transport system substrate-binding protein
MKGSLIFVIGLALAVEAKAGTLDDVRSRGALNCGVNGHSPGFSLAEARGRWTGFEVDYCRAYAAALFNDAEKVRFVEVTAADRFTALQSGRIDVLLRNTVWSNEWEAEYDLLATGAVFYDGQGFLVRKAQKITGAGELGRRSICVERGTMNEVNLTEYFGSRVNAIAFTGGKEALKAYDAQTCDALTDNQSSLHVVRLSLAKIDDHTVMPDIISRVPLSPFVRHGDDTWFSIIRWVHFAMLEAEALGVTQTNVDQQRASDNPSIRQLLESKTGERWGLTPDWAYRVVKRVGNYSEVFDQNLGAHSIFGMERGPNALWTRGGLFYPPQFH